MVIVAGSVVYRDWRHDRACDRWFRAVRIHAEQDLPAVQALERSIDFLGSASSSSSKEHILEAAAMAERLGIDDGQEITRADLERAYLRADHLDVAGERIENPGDC